jgi:imidazolonepropionase-like amidohydrolase
MRILWKMLAAFVALLLVGALALGWLLAPPAPLTAPAADFELNDVTLIVPGAGGRREEHRRIVGKGGRIVEVGPAIEGSGPFSGMRVLPGLTDAHVHFPPPTIPGQSELFTFLMLYHGITAVRDAGDVDGTSSAPPREGVASGAFPGPRIYACGPFLDGRAQWQNTLIVDSPESARDAVGQVDEGGFDCVKAYGGLTGEALAAIRDEAEQRGLPVIGHVPTAVPYAEARLDDAQHLIGVSAPSTKRLPFPWVLESWLETDDARRDDIIATSLAHAVTNTPTLITSERLVASRDYDAMRKLPELRLLPRFFRDVIWAPGMGLSAAGLMSPEDFEMVAAANEQMLVTVKRMHEAGAELHTGTDTLVAWIVPGKALHRELRLLGDAGISAADVMALSSVVTAKFLDADGVGLGTIAEGGPAELVVYREDPTRDLAALDSIAAVVRDGRLYTRAQLDEQLARYQAWFEGPIFDAVLTPVVRRVLSQTVDDGAF